MATAICASIDPTEDDIVREGIELNRPVTRKERDLVKFHLFPGRFSLLSIATSTKVSPSRDSLYLGWHPV